MTGNKVQGSSVRCLCFDFNGTLVDSFSLVLGHYTRIAPEYGCRVPNPEERERLRGLHAKEVLDQLGVPYRHIPRMILRMREAVQADLMDLAPVPGIRDAIKRLSGAGYRLGILSSSGKEYIRAYLTRHGIDGIDFVSTSNVLLGKSKALGKIACNEGISPQELLYIGDELRDFEAANKASCLFAAATWGYTNAAALEQAGVDLICRSPTDLVDAASA